MLQRMILEMGMDQGDIRKLICSRERELGFVFFVLFSFWGERLWCFLGVKKWMRGRHGDI